MYYVEFLRVVRTLRVVGYVLGVFLLLALIGRPFSHGSFMGPNTIAGVDPSAIPAHVNADGSTTQSFVGKQGERVTLRMSKNHIETISVQEAASSRHAIRYRRHHVGSITVTTSKTGRSYTETITNDVSIPISMLLMISGGFAAIVATIFGLALSRENDGHLELAWTKPASRDSYALGAIALDVVGIFATGLVVFAASLIFLGIYGGAQYIRGDEHVLATLAFVSFFALSFYGIVLAATSSMRRGGLVLALLWPAALILPGLVHFQWMSIGTVARTLNTINPVAYLYAYASSPDMTNVFTLLPNGAAVQILAPIAIFVAGLALSVAQWRRLEA